VAIGDAEELKASSLISSRSQKSRITREERSAHDATRLRRMFDDVVASLIQSYTT